MIIDSSFVNKGDLKIVFEKLNPNTISPDFKINDEDFEILQSSFNPDKIEEIDDEVKEKLAQDNMDFLADLEPDEEENNSDDEWTPKKDKFKSRQSSASNLPRQNDHWNHLSMCFLKKMNQVSMNKFKPRDVKSRGRCWRK